jgi:hypothetical protein
MHAAAAAAAALSKLAALLPLQVASGEEEEEKVLTKWGCFFWLTLVTLLISVLSDYVMATIKIAAKDLNVSVLRFCKARCVKV